MIPIFKAFIKDTEQIVDVAMIFFDGVIKTENNDFYLFEDIILMQSTGIYDKHGVEIFEGDVIQQVHAYDFDKLEIETDYLEPFEVKKGNYAQGWISKKTDTEYFSVTGYVFGKNVKIIGNVHQNPELLEKKWS